jgi:hypothetical protein
MFQRYVALLNRLYDLLESGKWIGPAPEYAVTPEYAETLAEMELLWKKLTKHERDQVPAVQWPRYQKMIG